MSDPTRRLVLPAIALAVLFTSTASLAEAQARTRATTGRARMELAFDHGYGFGSEGDYLELAADLRVYAPFGLGVVLRGGAAVAPFSIAYVAELGLAYRLDLITTDCTGLQLGVVAGPSVAYGPFDRGEVPAVGGWGMLHLDLWHRNFFFGIGVTAHALEVLPNDAADNRGPPRAGPLLTVTPMLRIGGEWGL